MAHHDGEDVYATLLTNDTYLPGALVLAHSLRDAGTTKKLAVLVTLDTVATEVVTQLKNVFDYVLSVPRIQNEAAPGNLNLMNRPDLHSAFTKINLWKQLQFRKIVYIDADVVAYRAPDELFDLEHAFAAAPDIGWPDLFNTGVMVIKPDLGEYYALSAMAQRGISFDGADQGLLNMHFKNSYHRLPFTYNVTPSAHYQYLPAYRHFQSSINMVHFIGSDKPWFQGRHASHGGGAYDEMVGQWWAVYDRHYRAATPAIQESGVSTPTPPEIVQYFVKGEFNPTITYKLTADESPLDLGRSTYGQHFEPLPPPQSFSAHPEYQQPYLSQYQSHDGHDHHDHHEQPGQPGPGHHEDHGHHGHHGTPPEQHHVGHDQVGTPTGNPPPPSSLPPPLLEQENLHPPTTSVYNYDGNTNTETRADQVQGHDAGTSQPPVPEHKSEPSQPPVIEKSWDAQWQAPPANAKPEAMNFPKAHYEMSRDTTPFVAPQRYPSPPRDMWYEVPKEAPAPTYHKPASIFPWETNQPAPTRIFAEPPPPPPAPEPTHTSQSEHHIHTSNSSFEELGAEPSTFIGSPSVDLKTEPTTPTMSRVVRDLPPSDPWANFTRSNAWDGVPQIERYVDAFQKQHGTKVKGRSLAPGTLNFGSAGGSFGRSGEGGKGRGLRVTDFPSEVERPSLPVTPAPIRRSTHWGAEDVAVDASGERLLPAAQGVPQQADWVCAHGVVWTPADCLCSLANILGDMKDPATQLQKLAQEQSRLLLEKLGQQDTTENKEKEGGDETPKMTLPLRDLPAGSEGIRSPTYVAQAPVVSPKPIKPGGLETSSVRSIYDQSSGESSANDGTTSDSTEGPTFEDTKIAEPAYLGPGIVFEKDEGAPTHGQTAALPSEEELDVLDN